MNEIQINTENILTTEDTENTEKSSLTVMPKPNAVIARSTATKQSPTIERFLCAVNALSVGGGCFAALAMTFFVPRSSQ
jgi:hypothetical protein